MIVILDHHQGGSGRVHGLLIIPVDAGHLQWVDNRLEVTTVKRSQLEAAAVGVVAAGKAQE